jgi:arylsulfatase A-like enzyme
VLAVALMLFAGCTSGEPVGTPGANIVLITIDTLRADHLGAYGYERATSPNLDALATDAILFRNAFSVSSWTLPAHASILTGLYPAEHGVDKDISALPASAVTLAEVLRENDYETFAAVSHVYLSDRWGFDAGFTDFDETAAIGSPHQPVAKRIVDSALGWLESREGGKSNPPFFVWLHIFDPHWDYSPPSPYDTLFDPHYSGGLTGAYSSLAPYIKAVKGYDTPPPLADHDLRHLLALYDGEIAFVDAQLGRLFDALKARGDWDDTLVVAVADHGEEFMEHGSLEGHQWTLHDEVIQVPLMIRLPQQRSRGKVVDSVVSTVGVAGTILDYVAIDSERRSLTAAIEGEKGRRAHVSEALLDLTVRHRDRQLGLRTKDFKFIRFADGRVQLFRHPQDPHEAEDVSDRRPNDVARLSRRVDELLHAMKRLSDAGAERQALSPRVRDRLRATGYLD